MCHYYRQNQANLQAERNKERLTGDRKYAYTKGQSDRIKEHLRRKTTVRLYMVRHGETDWNKAKKVQGRADIPLNAYGRELAEKTAEGLRGISFDLAYTSPLSRAKETAQIVLQGRKIPLIEEPQIQEICFGDYEGIVYRGEGLDPQSAEFVKFFDDTANYIPKGEGESVGQLMERVDGFLKALYQNPELQDKMILLSTHGAAVTAMKNCIKNEWSPAKFWQMGVPKNCAVTIVEVEGGIPKIIEEDKLYY